MKTFKPRKGGFRVAHMTYPWSWKLGALCCTNQTFEIFEIIEGRGSINIHWLFAILEAWLGLTVISRDPRFTKIRSTQTPSRVIINWLRTRKERSTFQTSEKARRAIKYRMSRIRWTDPITGLVSFGFSDDDTFGIYFLKEKEKQVLTQIEATNCEIVILYVPLKRASKDHTTLREKPVLCRLKCGCGDLRAHLLHVSCPCFR